MPLITVIVAAYLAGVLAGFAGWLLWVVAAALVGGVFALLVVHDGRVVALGLVAICGAAASHAAKIDREHCGAQVVTPVVAILDRDAAPGTFVPAELSCGASISLFVEVGSGPAGSTVRVTGTVRRSASGIVVQRAVVRVVAATPMWPRLRTAAGRNIDRVFGEDAPLVRALIIADKHELSPELRDRFTNAGLAHVLAISGLHIGLIAAMVELMLYGVRVPMRARSPVAFGLMIVYITMIGAPPAAVRAGVMLGGRAFTRWWQRPTSPLALLALASASPVLDPWIALEPGFQLSVVGVAAFIVGSRVPARLGVAANPKWRRTLVSALICSTIATIVTAPLVAWTFGRVSTIAPLSSVIAIPLVALLHPILFAALCVSTGPGAAFVAGAAHPLITVLQRIAVLAASVPWGSFAFSPSPWSAAIGGVASLSVLTACGSRRPGRALIVAAVCAAVLAMPTPTAGSVLTGLHVIDVGQGDAIALRTRRGHWVLFDAGPAGFGVDAGKAIVIPYVERHGGTVAAFVLSHPHTDHVGGAAAVIDAFHPAAYYDPGYAAPTDFYRRSLQAALADHAAWHRVHPGDSLVVDEVTINLLAPDSVWATTLRDPNNASTIALVRVGEVRFLLVGDAERSEEDWLLQHDSADLHADVLKVGHHGSNTSSTPAFLNAVHPRLALVSVGAGNKYGHPSPETMRSIAEHGAEVLRTDLVGTIVVRTDGHTMSVDAGGDHWPLRAPPQG
jgi:competence protein ComEC